MLQDTGNRATGEMIKTHKANRPTQCMQRYS